MSLLVERCGQGPSLVLLHGWGINSSVWQSLLLPLSEYFRITSIDLPGYGYNAAKMPEHYNLEQLAQQVASVIPQDSTVLGWSMGGLIATSLALHHPQQVENLILVASSPQFTHSDDWPHGIKQSVLKQFGEDLANDYRDTIMRFIAIQALGGDQAKQQMRQLKAHVLDHGEPDIGALHGGLDLLLNSNLRPQLSNITCPTLLIAGDKDTLCPSSAIKHAAEQIPNANYLIVNNASHAPFLSHPDLFIDTLKQFSHEQ